MYRVFLNEDEPWALLTLKLLIDWGKYGFLVVGEANEGVVALERIKSIKPDLIISDIRMPGMTGLDLIEEVRDQELMCEVLLVSGYADFEYAKQAISLGVMGYLLKPVKEEDLIANLLKVKRTLDTRMSKNKELDVRTKEIGFQTEKSKVEQIVHYIRANYEKPLSLQTVANEFHMSESHISNLVKKRSGKRFSEHLTEARIQKAQELLCTTNDTIEQIAEQVGYIDAFYFSRVYKKKTGISPAEFRRQI